MRSSNTSTVDTTNKQKRVDNRLISAEGIFKKLTLMEINSYPTSTGQEQNPIAKQFVQPGLFDQFIQRFTGLEFKPMELQSVTMFEGAKPTEQDKYHIKYEQSDFNVNTVTVIKKLRDGANLVFTVFQTNKNQGEDEKQQDGVPETDIIVTKSRSFTSDIEGGKILADLLLKLDL